MIELIALIRNALLEFRERVIRIVPTSDDDGGSELTDRAFYRWFLLRILTPAGMIAVM